MNCMTRAIFFPFSASISAGASEPDAAGEADADAEADADGLEPAFVFPFLLPQAVSARTIASASAAQTL